MRSAGLPSASTGHTDDPAGHLPLELVLGRKKGRVRTAVAHRHAEPLRVADTDVRPPRTRRFQQRQAQEVCRYHDVRVCRVRLVAESGVVVDGLRRWWGTGAAPRRRRP